MTRHEKIGSSIKVRGRPSPMLVINAFGYSSDNIFPVRKLQSKQYRVVGIQGSVFPGYGGPAYLVESNFKQQHMDRILMTGQL